MIGIPADKQLELGMGSHSGKVRNLGTGEGTEASRRHLCSSQSGQGKASAQSSWGKTKSRRLGTRFQIEACVAVRGVNVILR